MNKAIGCLKFAIAHADLNKSAGHGPCVENIDIEAWELALTELEEAQKRLEWQSAKTAPIGRPILVKTLRDGFISYGKMTDNGFLGVYIFDGVYHHTPVFEPILWREVE